MSNLQTYSNKVNFFLTKEQKDFINTHLISDPKSQKLKVGDTVEWTNDYGVKWVNKIIGFNYTREYNKKYNKFVHLNTDSYWFPHKADELTVIS